jgi:hypothetical protein
VFSALKPLAETHGHTRIDSSFHEFIFEEVTKVGREAIGTATGINTY